MWDFRSSLFNPRHGPIGLLGWPAMFLFEFMAPIVEFLGYLVVPVSLFLRGHLPDPGPLTAVDDRVHGRGVHVTPGAFPR